MKDYIRRVIRKMENLFCHFSPLCDAYFVPFTPADNRVDKVMESKESHGKAKLYDVSSRIRLTPTAEDDYINYTCEAQHEALPLDMALKVTVQLSVMCK